MNRIVHKKRKTRGFTMLEVLVALVIMSVGFLGVAALQLTGMRSVNAASYRTQASLMASDIIERMRANPTRVDAGHFMDIDAATADIDCTTIPATYCGEFYDETDGLTVATNCNATQLADYDLTTWFCGVNYSGTLVGEVVNTLPQATATIVCTDTDPASGPDGNPCTPDSPHTVTIGWQELNPNKSGGAATITQGVSVTVIP